MDSSLSRTLDGCDDISAFSVCGCVVLTNRLPELRDLAGAHRYAPSSPILGGP